MFNEHAILNELNPLLREKVINYNCRSLVKARFHWSFPVSLSLIEPTDWRTNENFEKSVDFLNAADTDFVSDLIAKLKFEVYLQADEIIREGSVGSHMYFINSGTVQVTTKNGMKPRYLSGTINSQPFFGPQNWSHLKFRFLKSVISEGEHFGEICLFVSNLKRTASIIATTNVSVYILRNESNKCHLVVIFESTQFS